MKRLVSLLLTLSLLFLPVSPVIAASYGLGYFRKDIISSLVQYVKTSQKLVDCMTKESLTDGDITLLKAYTHELADVLINGFTAAHADSNLYWEKLFNGNYSDAALCTAIFNNESYYGKKQSNLETATTDFLLAIEESWKDSVFSEDEKANFNTLLQPFGAESTKLYSELTDAERNTYASQLTAFDADEYISLDYIALAHNPEDHIDEKVKFPGRVVQVIGSRKDGYSLRIAVNGDFDHMIYVTVEPSKTPDSNILNKDYLYIYGTCAGEYSYTSTLRMQITVPLVHGQRLIIQEQ